MKTNNSKITVHVNDHHSFLPISPSGQGQEPGESWSVAPGSGWGRESGSATRAGVLQQIRAPGGNPVLPRPGRQHKTGRGLVLGLL